MRAHQAALAPVPRRVRRASIGRLMRRLRLKPGPDSDSFRQFTPV